MSEPSLASAQRWVLRAAAFGLPLVYSPFTYDSYVLPKLLTGRAVVLVLLAIQLARFVVRRRVEVRRTPIDIAWLVFIASAALSTVFAINTNVAVFGTYGRYDGLLTFLLYAALFWVAVQTIQSRGEARTVLRFVMAGGYVAAAIAIAQSLHDSVGTDSIAPAFGTLGNPNVLGGFLAMVLALAVGEALHAASRTARVIAINVVVVVGLALLMTLSRSGWVAAAAGAGIVAIVGRRPVLRVAAVGAAAAGFVLVLVALASISGGSPLEQRVQARASAILDPGASRIGIWKDSLRIAASRPVVGYGPDTVGLVFPRFQSGDWGLAAGHIRQQIDKAHAETIQIGATQGAIGVAAYLFLVAMFIRAFWQGRRSDFAVPIFAAWVAYELAIQVNFTALASALPFWIFAAAAVASWGGEAEPAVLAVDRLAGATASMCAALLLAAGLVVGVVLPFLADANLKTAVQDDFAGHPELGAPLARQAARLGPQEPVYATEVGNIAFERSDWAGARNGYQEAARLGVFNPLVYRNLALADQRLGLIPEARDAALKAVELDPYDPANQALLAQLS